MKIRNLALAVAASLCASQAFALGIVASKNATLKLNVSGATAADIQFSNYITQVCTPGTLDTFRNPADNSRAFSCSIAAGEIAGVAGGTSALFRKESGGSATGVTPIINNTTLNGIDLDTCVLSATPNLWTCSNTTLQVPSELGISDVEPELFTITANSIGAITDPNGVGQLNVSSVNAQTFGIVVTPDLRNALQAAQGLVVGSDDVANMPSLSSALIANIFASRMANWGTLVDSTGTGINATAVKTNSNAVEVCLRAPGSGTQAQFNAFYMGNSCLYRGASSKQFLGFSTPPDGNGINNDIVRRQVGPVLTPPPYIHAGVGSSDVGKCMTQIAAANRTAIGVQSMEKVAETLTDRNNFKYVAVDGVAPTLENMQAGLYRNWASLSIQWRNDVLSGIKLAAAQKFVELAQAMGPVADFNASLKAAPLAIPAILDATDASGRADVGTLAFAGKSGNPSILGGWDAAEPLFAFDKATGLGNPSSCAAARLVSGQKVDVSYSN